MDSEVKSGYLIVADVSGYTRFLAETELEHANGIIKDLFNSIVPLFDTTVQICKFMGDAVFAHTNNTAIEKSQYMIDFAKSVYNAFADKKELIHMNTTCACNACKNMEELDLKIFLHHGEYINQNFNGTDDLAGSDVNTIFRLMKNSVVENTSIEAYLLITRSALQAMELESNFSNKTFMSENYDHIGDVDFVVEDLSEYWEQHKQVKRHYVEESDPLLFEELSLEVDVPANIAFLLYTRPEFRTKVLFSDKIDIFNGSGSTQSAGTNLHCHHGEVVYKMEITDWNPGKYVSLKHALAKGISARQTVEFVESENGCIIKIRLGELETSSVLSKIKASGIAKGMKKDFPPAFQMVLKSMRELAKTILDDNQQLNSK